MIITSYKYEWQVIGGIFGGIYIYIYSFRKSNNYSLKSAHHKSVIILCEENDVKQLYFVLKVSCRRTNNLQPGLEIAGSPT